MRETSRSTKHDGPARAVPADRWVEMDLCWIDRDDIAGSVEILWERYAPLFAGVAGERGLILNVGWMAGYILEWSGNLGDRLPLPLRQNMERHTHSMALTGTTAERMAGWKKRFEHFEFEPMTYPPWTYADLKQLVRSLKAAAARHGIGSLRVGALLVGATEMYGKDEPLRFARKHPRAFGPNPVGLRWMGPAARPDYARKLRERGTSASEGLTGTLDPEGVLSDDSTHYAAFPKGVRAGMPIAEFLGAQWGSLSRAVGLEALVLRDGLIGMGLYMKVGPFGQQAPADSSRLERFHRATADLVKAIKLANPDAWVIGYSNGASAVADWRVNCVDLEAIAKEGYLDAYIDQTWAGAWNEVGQRNNTFWNMTDLGWTAQLAFVLLHAAALAETNVRHYTLTETFDNWEAWDIIHLAPDRLRWGIWAYLHAGVKTPAGLKFPGGTYISWANQGKRLLSEEDVRFLSENTNEAILDAQQTDEIAGPTLVYNRSAMEWQSAQAPHISIKEWIDEQAALVIKSSVPILSVTRLEYLPRVKSDLFILQTPVHLKPAEQQNVMALLRSGEPVAIWGSPAGGIDPEIAQLAGLTSRAEAIGELEFSASLATRDSELAEGMPAGFKIYHLFSQNTAVDGAQVLYTVGGSPALVLNQNVLTWDPGDYGLNVGQYPGADVMPITEIVGSPYGFALVGRALSRMLRERGRFSASSRELQFPVTVGAWRRRDGRCRILVCDTEEGFDHSAENKRTITVELPLGWPRQFADCRTGGRVSAVDGKFDLVVDRAGCRLLEATGPIDTSRKGCLPCRSGLMTSPEPVQGESPIRQTLRAPVPLRIMPVGDSITVGYTDNPDWNVPFEFGYRSGLYSRLTKVGCKVQFVGTSDEPWNRLYGDPSRGGTVKPSLDLRTLGQDHHEGYGGRDIAYIQSVITNRIAVNRPDVILLLIGINGMSAQSPAQLSHLVGTMVAYAPEVHLIVAQITPYSTYSADLFNYNTYINDTLVPTLAAQGSRISTVDLYTPFLADPADPTSIGAGQHSNKINHPTAVLYDKMAEAWFDGIMQLGLINKGCFKE